MNSNCGNLCTNINKENSENDMLLGILLIKQCKIHKLLFIIKNIKDIEKENFKNGKYIFKINF